MIADPDMFVKGRHGQLPSPIAAQFPTLPHCCCCCLAVAAAIATTSAFAAAGAPRPCTAPCAHLWVALLLQVADDGLPAQSAALDHVDDGVVLALQQR